MIIVGGNEFVSTGEKIVVGCDAEGSGLTPINLVYEVFDKNAMAKYKSLIQKGVSLALHAADLKELVYVCNLGAKYVVAYKEDAHSMQKASDNYMFDTKVLVLIDEEEDMEWVVANEIDGVIFATEEMDS